MTNHECFTVANKVLNELRNGDVNKKNLLRWCIRGERSKIHKDMSSLTFMVTDYYSNSRRVYICLNEVSNLYKVYIYDGKRLKVSFEEININNLNETINKYIRKH